MEPHTLWLPNEIMDGETITFVLLAYYWAKIKIEHAGESITIASPMLRKAVREYWRWITQTIGNIITSNIHRCLDDQVGNIVDVSPMCVRHV